MAFEIQNYSIKEKLPEWWKNDLLLEPINQYTQELIVEMLGSLLNNLGVVQPVQVWKELPEEYNWVHRYYSGDVYLNNQANIIFANTPTIAYLPNTKRKCHAIIKLSLLGNEQGEKEFIDLKLTNGFQEINFSHISNMANIEINTLSNNILINGNHDSKIINGFFNKIQPIARNTQYDEVDIDDENKKTQIQLDSNKNVLFDLEIELIKPVYTTEQHIRLATVSAFPLEWIKLYGFYCHDFNNKEGYQQVWEKSYTEESRTVYDKITTQFDFERFYVQVKYYGISMPLFFGFPQETFSSSGAFAINEKLDKWGKIYGLPRRVYRHDINEDEEPFTFPKYYNYPIEQDYWYEERLVNEYRYNENAINAAFIKDTDLNNVAILESIDPFINDVWVYTESILPKADYTRETGDILPCNITELESNGVSWEYPQAIMQENMISQEIIMEPLNSSSVNNHSYQTKELDLKFKTPELPENINITGIELKINAETDIHSEALKIDNRSKMLLPFCYTKDNGDNFSIVEEININTEDIAWKKGQRKYTLGNKNYLFGLDTITREQIKDYLHFKIGFTNESDFLQATLLIYTITANIYYEIIQDNFKISTEFNTKEIFIPNKINKFKNQNAEQILSKYQDTEIVPDETGICTRVIDGDTIIIDDDKRIRFVGVNTPETDESGFDAAKEFVEKICLNKEVGIKIDSEKPTDNYDRTLGVVIVDNKNLNEILLQEGLAEVMYIPPSEFLPYNWAPQNEIQMKINIENIGNTDIKDKNLMIVLPPELKFRKTPNEFNTNNNIAECDFELNKNEVFIIGEDSQIIIKPVHNITGRYDILTICDEKIITNEILIRKGFE